MATATKKGKPSPKRTQPKFVEKTYRLSGNRTSLTFTLKVGMNHDLLVTDPKTNMQRSIRHCLNEKTIFIDEQSDNAIVSPIVFMGGYLEVPPEYQITQQFLDAHPSNEANGGSWFEYVNDEIEAEESIEWEELGFDIKKVIRDKANEDGGVYELEAVYAVIADSIVTAESMGVQELKRELYKEVDRNPQYFVDEQHNITIFEDEFLKRKHLALKAIKAGILKRSANLKSILWVENNESIFTAPIGLDLIDSFADFLATDDGIMLIENLTNRL